VRELPSCSHLDDGSISSPEGDAERLPGGGSGSCSKAKQPPALVRLPPHLVGFRWTPCAKPPSVPLPGTLVPVPSSTRPERRAGAAAAKPHQKRLLASSAGGSLNITIAPSGRQRGRDGASKNSNASDVVEESGGAAVDEGTNKSGSGAQQNKLSPIGIVDSNSKHEDSEQGKDAAENGQYGYDDHERGWRRRLPAFGEPVCLFRVLAGKKIFRGFFAGASPDGERLLCGRFAAAAAGVPEGAGVTTLDDALQAQPQAQQPRQLAADEYLRKKALLLMPHRLEFFSFLRSHVEVRPEDCQPEYESTKQQVNGLDESKLQNFLKRAADFFYGS